MPFIFQCSITYLKTKAIGGGHLKTLPCKSNLISIAPGRTETKRTPIAGQYDLSIPKERAPPKKWRASSKKCRKHRHQRRTVSFVMFGDKQAKQVPLVSKEDGLPRLGAASGSSSWVISRRSFWAHIAIDRYVGSCVSAFIPFRVT